MKFQVWIWSCRIPKNVFNKRSPCCWQNLARFGPPNLHFRMVFMVNNLVFRWPTPSFFMVLGAHGFRRVFRPRYFASEFCGKVFPAPRRLESRWVIVTGVNHCKCFRRQLWWNESASALCYLYQHLPAVKLPKGLLSYFFWKINLFLFMVL